MELSPEERQCIYLEKLLMKSADDGPSVWDVRRCLLSSVDYLEGFAHHRSEHATAVTSFSQEIRRIQKELMSSFEEDYPPSSLHEVVAGLMGAKAIVWAMAERHPEKSVPLTGFVESLKHAQEEFIQRVQRDVKPQA